MNITSEIIKIKKYLSSFQTKDVLGFISAILIPFGNSGKEVANSADILNKTSLMAPMKQFLYLAGLLVSTEYDINNSRHLNIKEKTNDENPKKWKMIVMAIVFVATVVLYITEWIPLAVTSTSAALICIILGILPKKKILLYIHTYRMQKIS